MLKPILFSTQMVHAILEGRKTQTRRVIKNETIQADTSNIRFVGNSNDIEIPRPAIKYDDRVWYMWNFEHTNAISIVERCPIKVGDILWVRETYRPVEQDYGPPRFEYKATETINTDERWKPSIFMPKDACRIFLKMNNVRVEQLNDISDEDAINEGILPLLMSGAQFATHGQLYKNYLERYVSRFQDGVYPKLSFKTLWESINGLYSWGKNPFVWVYEFERVEKPEVWP